jgi:FlaG/FlaF family flagellin (archaellin)
MKSKTLTAIALASMTLGLATTAEAAVTKTKITISNEDEEFTGSLSSSKASCESDRKVTLFKVTLNGKGAVIKSTKVGSDVTNDDGDWTVKSGKTGRFRATVKATSKCGGATSKIIKVVEEN